MACDLALQPNGSFHQNTGFGDDWKTCDNNGGNLDAIAAFNASFEHPSTPNSHSIDPQLLTNEASSSHVGHTFSDDGSTFQTNDFFSANTQHNGPYFQHSADQSDQILHRHLFLSPSPLRNQLHRRSVSEPPDQHLHAGNILPGPQPPNPVFTRAGVTLGAPRHPPSTSAQRIAKSKQPIYRQPFSVVKRQTQRPERYHLRRANTQPMHMHSFPTSAPAMPFNMESPQPPAWSMAPPQAVEMGSPTPMITSRVCTPAPSPEHAASPAQVDSRLASPGPARLVSQQQSVSIPLTIDELKALIREAVRSAVEAVMAQKTETGQRTTDGVARVAEHGVGAQEPGDGAADSLVATQANPDMEQILQSIEDDGMQW